MRTGLDVSDEFPTHVPNMPHFNYPTSLIRLQSKPSFLPKVFCLCSRTKMICFRKDSNIEEFEKCFSSNISNKLLFHFGSKAIVAIDIFSTQNPLSFKLIPHC